MGKWTKMGPGRPAGQPAISGAPVADLPEDIVRDVLAIGRIDAVPTLLRVVCETTGMGFAAVARVTGDSWTACAVQDDIAFGLKAGGQLDVHTTLCKEVRASGEPVVIDHASQDAIYCNHHTPNFYKIESYISVPIVLPSGEYFGNLCAIDPRPARLSEPRTVGLFTLLAELISVQLANDRARELEQTALLDAQAAGELREQFIAILGHDLRGPLAAVSACAEVLQRKAPSPEIAGLGQRIASSARRMSGLIGDVLDFARGRLGGGFGAEMASVTDLERALHDVVAEAQDSNPSRTIVARLDISGAVWCDRARVQQLVANLLANAVTHGAPGGEVTLEGHLAGGLLCVAVTNGGDPIPPEHLPHLFGPFYRSSTSRSREGLGLGLFICAQIVRAHGGTLTVTSTRAQGTRFAATWPRHSAA